MPYRYLPDIAIADAAFEASGTSLEELFSTAVDAVLGVMVKSPEAIPPGETRSVSAEDPALDILLYSLLSEIVYYKDADHLLLRCPQPVIRHEGGLWRLSAVLEGGSLDESGELLLDVKAVTLHMLSVERSAGGWTARVVVDI